MTDSIVERVARAIYEATPFKESAGGYDQQSGVYQRMCRLLARAAIEAMMEPTPEMIREMDAWTDLVVPDGLDNSKEGRSREFSVAWKVAILVALSNPDDPGPMTGILPTLTPEQREAVLSRNSMQDEPIGDNGTGLKQRLAATEAKERLRRALDKPYKRSGP